MAARLSPPTRRGLLRGLLAYRWLTVAWAVLVFTWEVTTEGSSDGPVANPTAGFALLTAAVVVTAWLTTEFRQRPDRLVRPPAILVEIALGTVMLGADTWVYGPTDHAQTLPTVWVVAAVASAAIGGGRRAAVLTGVGMGLARTLGQLLVDDRPGASLTGLTTIALLGVSGWVLGYLLQRLVESESSISAYRAREEVARTLHDGVLQTLALIQRQAQDDELRALARSQEQELRRYLFDGSGSSEASSTDLAAGLRAAARRAEQRYDIRVTVVAAPDLPAIEAATTERLAAAAGEALTNASKHGAATTATIYAEPDDNGGVFVSIKDNGVGFDPAETSEGEGLSRSIRGRMTEIGGRVEIDGRPGRGVEVRMWV